MRFQNLLGYGLGIAALLQSVLASPLGDPVEPEVEATAAFPEDNPFGHVVNGERNNIILTVENKAERNITLQTVAGSIHHPETNVLTTALSYKIPLLQGVKLQVPYAFYSEFKPGDWKLNLWIDYEADGDKYRTIAYESIITVVEPEGSWFDIQLWITYAIVAAFLGGLGYYAYSTFVPQPKKRKTPAVSAPVGTVTATGAGGYQEEWIPEHHLKKPKARKTKATATSGEETSGTELSAAEGRKRKGRK
ncbi:hypothetical protein NM688_g3354 [Phlebia brevispora]|uniref:Uncharacterized protein n=1 Tax=Phlebia brevispora TaxID=194682 RepID=A0ACC1T6D7_9APHY|nr:hypothetical protein NM688_g3354 [Phlebia brevispora]